MGLKIFTSVILAFFLSTSAAQGPSGVFDITKYGAKANGHTDITQVLLNVWKEACASTSPSKVLIPRGTYSLGIVKLSGPCKSHINLEVQGTLVAPTLISGDSWVTFSYLDGFKLCGRGTFDGQGHEAWGLNDCGKNAKCKSLAVNLRFNFISNGLVRDITSLNSKNFHVNVLGCKNFAFQSVTITAPGTSINTDGIHIGRSNGVNITDTNIGTGDDCISLGDGSQQVRITRVNCGPGHGISVGSLGKYENEEPVSGSFVKNCTLYNTDNGVRVKSWPALHGGLATDMHFEDVAMVNVANPVIIDQVYCPWNQCNAKIPSKVKISNVSFKNVRGTSRTPLAIILSCSSGIPCENVELADIDLTYTGIDAPAKSQCTNVRPRVIGKLNPAGC